jgi:hypothetical protein
MAAAGMSQPLMRMVLRLTTANEFAPLIFA